MSTHPFIPFKVVPNPASGVSVPIDFGKLAAGLHETLKKISQRNKALIPADLYERAKRAQKEA